ncbi:MAG: MBL fold metallo-hydrolase [Oscillospiraceae bacterium]
MCIYIEYGERKLLLDTGASELFAENAEKLGLDLSAVDAAVLSHAHYDHGNGMEAFFRRNDHAPFYVGPTCAADCYAGRWLFRRYIGIPPHGAVGLFPAHPLCPGKNGDFSRGYPPAPLHPGPSAGGPARAYVPACGRPVAAGRLFPRAEPGAGNGGGPGYFQ